MTTNHYIPDSLKTPANIAKARALFEPRKDWARLRLFKEYGKRVETWPCFQDMVQTGQEWLWVACLRFDPERGIPFEAFGVHFLTRAYQSVVTEFRRCGLRGLGDTLEVPLVMGEAARTDEGEKFSLWDHLEQESTGEWENPAQHQMEQRALEKLALRAAEAIGDSYRSQNQKRALSPEVRAKAFVAYIGNNGDSRVQTGANKILGNVSKQRTHMVLSQMKGAVRQILKEEGLC